MDYYFKNPEIVEPYKIDKDKITTAISLIETTRPEQINKDDIIKMQFSNEQITEQSLNDLAYIKTEYTTSKSNLNDSKSELIPVQTVELEKKKRLKN